MEAAVEADSCGVESMRVIVKTCGLWGMWSSRGGQHVEASGRCGLMEVGVCERE